MRRITKAALGCFAGFALVLGGTQAASGAMEEKNWFRDTLTDLMTDDGPFDSATARITIAEKTDGSTTFRIRVRRIDTSYPVPDGGFGSHLHTGKCVEGDVGDDTVDPPVIPGFQAGGHYNDNAIRGLPAEISRNTEVWFDLVPDQKGVAESEAKVPFKPVDLDGEMSVVIHVAATNPTTGGASTRQACLPLDVSGILPDRI